MLMYEAGCHMYSTFDTTDVIVIQIIVLDYISVFNVQCIFIDVDKCCTLLCLPSLFRENITAVVMKDRLYQTYDDVS
jgi:hypothetical protein